MARHSGDLPNRLGDVDVYLSTLNGVDTALYYADRVRRLGGRPHLCFEPHIEAAVQEATVGMGLPLVCLPPATAAGRLLTRLHGFVRDHASSLVPGDNPANVGMFAPPSGWKRKVVLRLRRSRVRASPRAVNRALARVFAYLAPRRFPHDHVLAISVAATPLPLCRRGLVVDTVVDSWDHSVRKVSGYPTRAAVAWNLDLARDWQAYQGAERTACGPPVKLLYALDAAASMPAARPDRVLMYPVATSTHQGAWFTDELLLLDTVCAVTARAGWRLVVKPKPVNHPRDFDELLTRWPHAVTGAFHGNTSPLDFRLDGSYNAGRLRELAGATAVLNTVTTFGLDAACAGLPLVQVDLSHAADLPHLAAAARNQHLRGHLYRVTSPDLLLPRTRSEFGAQLLDVLVEGRLEGAGRASRHLRDWVSGSSDCPAWPARS